MDILAAEVLKHSIARPNHIALIHRLLLFRLCFATAIGASGLTRYVLLRREFNEWQNSRRKFPSEARKALVILWRFRSRQCYRTSNYGDLTDFRIWM